MTIVARRFCATPERAAGATWEAITALVCGDDATAKKEFEAVQGLACASVAEEAFNKNPLVVSGVGPRLRVYCLYGEDAVTGDNRSEGALTWKPTDGDWTAYLPCLNEDFVWIDREIRTKTSRFIAYDIDNGLPEAVREAEDTPSTTNSKQPLTIDVERFNSL